MTTQNFVLAFGGTGARCAEALTYLAAARAITAPLHLLVVDPDETNGNVEQALAQSRRYHSVQQHVRPSEHDGERPLFSTPLNAEHGPETFFWSNPQPNIEFSTLLEYSAQPADVRALLDLLYDGSDLSLTFEKGYIGRAHIGSLDLLRTLESQIARAASAPADETRSPDSMQVFFRALRAATQMPGGARLFVIGSVFGGTGASGIPAVPPLLDRLLLSGLQRHLVMGCVQVAPYFSFPPGGPENPDSALHPLATQAALYHYALTDTDYDRIYLVGAPGREQSNDENVAGGDAQRNSAHYVELAAALAAAHFFTEPPTGIRAEVRASGADEVIWSKLPFGGPSNVRKNLVTLATFCAMHGHFLARDLEEGRHLGAKWIDDLTARRKRSLGGQEPELRALREFSLRFLKWAAEIQRIAEVELLRVSERESEDALAALDKGGSSKRPYHEIYRRLSTVGEVDQETGQGWYVEALTRATTGFCAVNYSSWWGDQ